MGYSNIAVNNNKQQQQQRRGEDPNAIQQLQSPGEEIASVDYNDKIKDALISGRSSPVLSKSSRKGVVASSPSSNSRGILKGHSSGRGGRQQYKQQPSQPQQQERRRPRYIPPITPLDASESSAEAESFVSIPCTELDASVTSATSNTSGGSSSSASSSSSSSSSGFRWPPESDIAEPILIAVLGSGSHHPPPLVATNNNPLEEHIMSTRPVMARRRAGDRRDGRKDTRPGRARLNKHENESSSRRKDTAAVVVAVQQQQKRTHDESDETDHVRNSASQQALLGMQQRASSSEQEAQRTSVSRHDRGRNQQKQKQQRDHQLLSLSERENEVALMISSPATLGRSWRSSGYSTSCSGGGGQRSRSANSRGSRNTRGSKRSSTSHRSIDSNGSFYDPHRSSSPPRHYSTSSPHYYSSRLYPRCDLYMTIAAANLISIASMVASSSYYYASDNDFYGRTSSPSRSGVEIAALTLTSLSFTLSFLVGAGYFHGPFREYLTTTCIESRRSRYNHNRALCNDRRMTAEQLVVGVVFTATCIKSGLVLYPSGDSYLGVAGRSSSSEVWNTNLFYSTWISLYGGAYLLADVWCVNTNDGGGGGAHATTTTTANGSVGPSLKLWVMTVFSSICTAVTLLVITSSPICAGLLGETAYCSYALTSALLGVGSAVVGILCGACLVLLQAGGSDASATTKWIGPLGASAVFLLAAAMVALVTSPSGPGHEVGSAFLTSWMTFLFGVLLWKNSCIDSFLLSPDASPAPAMHNLKSLERQQQQQQVLRMIKKSGSAKSMDTGTQEGSTDDESELLQDSDSDEVTSIAIAPHEETIMIHPLEEQQQSRALPDPDETTVQDKYSAGYQRSCPQVANSAGYDADDSYNAGYDAEVGSYYSETIRQKAAQQQAQRRQHDNDESNDAIYGGPHNNNANEEATTADYSAYYSGSEAVQVRTGMQDDVSALGDLGASLLGASLTRPNSRANSFHQSPYTNSNVERHQDPQGVRASAYYQDRSRQVVDDPSTGPSTLNSTLSSREDAPTSSYSRDAPTSFVSEQDNSVRGGAGGGGEEPLLYRKSSQQESIDIDREWDFGSSTPSTPSRHSQEHQQLQQQQHRVPLMGEVDYKTVATATGDEPPKTPRPGSFPRRPSRESLMSNLSPLQEESREGSTESISPNSGMSTKSSVRDGSSRPGSGHTAKSGGIRSKASSGSRTFSTKSGSGSGTTKSGKSSSSESIGIAAPRSNRHQTQQQQGKKNSFSSGSRKSPARRTPPPPPPPRRSNNNQGSKKKSKKQANAVRRIQSTGSASIPTTIEGGRTSSIYDTAPLTKRMSSTAKTASTKPISSVGPSPNTTEHEWMASKKNKRGSHFHSSGPLTESEGSDPDNDDDKSSTSDFDIEVSDGHSVMTELTNDGFDNVVPHSATTGSGTSRLSAAVAAAKYAAAVSKRESVSNKPIVVETKGAAASDNSSYVPRSSLKKRSQHGANTATPETAPDQQHVVVPRAQGLPSRMPLYNGSDSSPSNRTSSPNSSRRDLLGQEVHPTVEAFLASAMKHARLSRSFGNFDGDMPPTTDDDEPSYDEDRDRKLRVMGRRRSGGISSGSSSSCSIIGGGGDGGANKRNNHQESNRSSKSRKSKSPPSSSGKSPSSSHRKPASSSKLLASMSEPDISQSNTQPLYNKKSSLPSPATALLETILASSHGESLRHLRRGSMQSFFSEDDNNTFSTAGGDFAC